MPLTVPLSLALGRYKQLPQRAGEVWQGGLVRLPVWIAHPTDPDGEPVIAFDIAANPTSVN